MRFFVNQPVTGLFIDVTGGMQHAVSPEHDLQIARLSGEALTLADQAFSDAKSARLRNDQQQPQLRRRLEGVIKFVYTNFMTPSNPGKITIFTDKPSHTAYATRLHHSPSDPQPPSHTYSSHSCQMTAKFAAFRAVTSRSAASIDRTAQRGPSSFYLEWSRLG